MKGAAMRRRVTTAVATVAALAFLRGGWAAAAPGAKAAPSPSPAAAPSSAKGAGDVVARVNGKPILRRDYDLAVQIQFRSRRNSVGLDELKVVRDRVLERLIENELLYQKASAQAVPVSDAEVQKEFTAIRDGYGSPAEFTALLQGHGVSESEFRDQLKRTLLVTRFVDREIGAGTPVTDDEVRRYYDQNPAEMERKEAVHLAQILVRAAPDAPASVRGVARQKIEEILKEARAGTAFEELAKKYSEGLDAKNGGDTGWMPRGSGPPAIERIAFSLPPGLISDVVESRLGFHLLKVIEKRPAGAVPFENAKERIRTRLQARARDARIRAYVDDLKERARIERLAAS